MSQPTTPLVRLLETLRLHAQSQGEKGGYFEQLVKVYLTHEPLYADLYRQAWLWGEWRAEAKRRFGQDPGGDAGIDLVAETFDGSLHAVQAKFHAENAVLRLEQMGGFFAASSVKRFSHRLVVLTNARISDALERAFADQNPPVSKITLADLEASRIDWRRYAPGRGSAILRAVKELRSYQEQAVQDALAGFKDADRGKLIMACGSGKTLTSLRLMERMTPAGGLVLVLVPSLALLSQSLSEWTKEASQPLHAYAVCSDHEVGKKRVISDDFTLTLHELSYPATTDAKQLAAAIKRQSEDRGGDRARTVIFSTYHSLEVMSQAQARYGLATFDLILCDEAHRTTGASLKSADGYDESVFVRVHDDAFLRGRKRLYMTATPRIYSLAAKRKADQDETLVYSMDDPSQFGRTFHTLNFSDAVNLHGILCDYKVIILTVPEDHVARTMGSVLGDQGSPNSLTVSDIGKIIGCWRALTKMDSAEDLAFDPEPMRRAVAFAQVIDPTPSAKSHKVSSREIAREFGQVVRDYRQRLLLDHRDQAERISALACEADHVDGGMGALEKSRKLDWLREPTSGETCRILCNVRCLSEGVDVPALDAVMFLTPRNSEVDVVQSVGRVMRKPPGGDKKLGYVILPVVIPAGVDPAKALDDNQSYKVVWEVLQALRAHDDRFDAMINRLQFDGQDPAKMEVIAIRDKLLPPSRSKGAESKAKPPEKEAVEAKAQPSFEFTAIERAIIAKVVQKCGDRLYWAQWAGDIARIGGAHITRLSAILEAPENDQERAAFDGFLENLRRDLNNSVTRDEAIEMLAQHMITKPVFDALFKEYRFTEHNPVSKAMQSVLQAFAHHGLERETASLQKLYRDVELRVEGTKTLAGKQRLIVELYDKFFRNAFPKMAERLGIVYTPVEIVDFILHSVNEILYRQFGKGLDDLGVHILDPFSGTGTFITRLLQSQCLSEEFREHAYRQRLHANEIVLLAYYIAAVNIEQVFHELSGGDYQPFEGMCLTDSFNLKTGKEPWIEQPKPDNSARLKQQRGLEIQVILGNPPYSVGQSSENDNNQNLSYPELDERIKGTYAKHSTATNKNALYDSYIRAIRWASDRIAPRGVIGFVVNAGWVDSRSATGLRKCLAEEFDAIYVVHLRGNCRTSGETRRREKDNVFGLGSRAPIAILLLVKNPQAAFPEAKIFFHDIGDYLTREQKLKALDGFGDVTGIDRANGWRMILPDKNQDWINQRDEGFEQFPAIGGEEGSIFTLHSNGVVTNRDSWAYNASKRKMLSNMERMIDFYNRQVEGYKTLSQQRPNEEVDIDHFINNDPKNISWSSSLKNSLKRQKSGSFDKSKARRSLYRPFCMQWLYFDGQFNHRVSQQPKLFPTADADNKVIAVMAPGSSQDFTSFIVDKIPDLHLSPGGTQCFPLYLYEEVDAKEGLFADTDNKADIVVLGGKRYHRRYAISDQALAYFARLYPEELVFARHIFHYIYGLLHSEEYKSRYADNLKKELPRIPAPRKKEHFWQFVSAGVDLAELHLGYENLSAYPAKLIFAKPQHELSSEDYRVSEMRFVKKGDKSQIRYNSLITLTEIPLEAYDYVVFGKSAIEWAMERQAVTTHKDSGIVNDANDWAAEAMGNPSYPLELLQKIITLSLKTQEIVQTLPPLDLHQGN